MQIKAINFGIQVAYISSSGYMTTLPQKGVKNEVHTVWDSRGCMKMRCVAVDDERGYARRTVSTSESRIVSYIFNRFPEAGSEGHVGVQTDPFDSEEGKPLHVGRLFYYVLSNENQFTILSLLFATWS